MATNVADAGTPAKKSRARKAAADTQTAPIAAVAPTNITTIPFGRLKRAPENVRRTDIAADVESLADDIAAHGLLQSLIGYAGATKIDAQVVYIVGGGRRLQALDMLRERGTIDEAWPVPVLIRPEADAIELSLSENLARRDMNPADEFTAFAALMAPGALSTNDLAKRFGFTETYIKQRLRLAALAPVVLDALRDGKLSLGFALEYAKYPDPDLQAKVFNALQRGPAYNRDNLWSLRAALSAEQMTEDSWIFRFIDRETYEREGGGYVEDLFAELQEGQGRKLTHGPLARKIAERCLQFQAGRVLSQAKKEYPSITGYVVPGTLVIDGNASAPAGYAAITGGWDSQLGQHVSVDACWKRALELEAPIQVVIGIEREKPIGEDDDGSPLGYVSGWDRTRFYVAKDMKKQVLPKKQTEYGGKVLTDEERIAQEIEREGRIWAARLAAPRFSDIPGFHGRAFYDSDWLDDHRVRPGDPVTGDRTPSFTVRVFVTEDEIAAHLDAGKAKAVEVREAREAAKVAREEQKQAAEQQRQDAFATIMAEIRALSEEPAVVMAAMYEGDEPTAWYRWESGDYYDFPEDHADAEDAMGVDGLEGLFDTAVILSGWYATIADFEATNLTASDGGK